MISYICAFLFGLSIPCVASRYGKVVASDWGEWLFYLWHKPHFPKPKTKKRINKLHSLWRKMVFFSFFWAIILTGLFIAIDLCIPQSAQLWAKIFVCFMALLSAIDQQYFLLPDIFTVPLIFIGFGYAIWANIIPVEQSFIGACYGFILPSVAVFVSSAFLKDAFGGGDVKMLVGLGTWFGVLPLCALLLISVISFGLFAIITKRRSAAYGPHLAFASIIVLFLTANHLIPFL
ncbi:MAG: prepilin peptidase [Alphaproteobacteria bacterium]|nr:prepilin peptidase [Alphaproteobacteria bacterium]